MTDQLTSERACNCCGKPAELTAQDPFEAEVFPEDGPYEDEDWCQQCYDQRKDDV